MEPRLEVIQFMKLIEYHFMLWHRQIGVGSHRAFLSPVGFQFEGASFKFG